MSHYKTDLQKIRDIAAELLSAEVVIDPSEFSFEADHPFAEKRFVSKYCEKGDRVYIETIDLRNEKKQQEWKEWMAQRIKRESLADILMMIGKPYRLFFLRRIRACVSDKDLGSCLASVWENKDSLSMNKNVSGMDVISLFMRADKNSLMSEDQRAFFDNLEEEVTVYRGVTGYGLGYGLHYQKAVSWTLDKETAEWFANRFRAEWDDYSIREVWKVTVPKNRILSSFTTDGVDNEGEVIVNLYRGNFQIERTVLE